MNQPMQLMLSNGIPVILQDYPGEVAATYWWVSTGSTDERPEEAGFAHFLEHMLFKDAAAKETGRASTGRTASAIESLGGDINAYTSFDQTVYHVTCAEQHWEGVLDVFGPMARPQRFLKSDFEREREVILEELRKNNDSPGRMLYQELFALNFGKHAYGRPVIGFDRVLKRARLPSLESFYRRQYASTKMGLILVGPLGDAASARCKAIIARAEKHFGSRVIPRAKAVTPRVSRASARDKRRATPMARAFAFDVKAPTVAIAFRAPELSHPDTPAIDLLGGILGQGEQSRLHQRLFCRDSLVVDASGGLFPQREGGMLYFQMECENLDKAKRAYEGLLETLNEIRSAGPDDAERERIINATESEKLYSTQTADGVASRVGFLRFVVGDLSYDREYLDRMRAADREAIRAVAERYLTPERMSLVVMVPKDAEKPDLSSWVAQASRLFQVKRSKSEPTQASGKPEVMRLSSGARIVYRYRPQSNVVSIHASALGGLRLELTDPVTTAARDWGSANLMALTWNKGVRLADGQVLGARQISSIVEGAAASLDGFSGRNTAGVQLTCLRRDWRRLADLFTSTLLSPVFDPAEVAHARRIAEDSIRGIEDHTSQLCSQLFLETLFTRHPYGRFTSGSLESVAGIDTERLQAFHRRWIRPDRLVIAISGNVSPSELSEWAKELDAQLMAMTKDQASAPRGPDAEPGLPAPRWVERKLGREQTHIVVGGMGVTMSEPDRWPLRLLNDLMAGQSGRLFIELREKRSLAYSVAPLLFEGMEPGYVATYIACAPAKRGEALAGIRAVHESIASKGADARSLARAREFYLGRRAMDLQSDSAIAAHLGLEEVYGNERLDARQVMERVREVTNSEIKEVCRKYFVDAPAVTSVVG